MTVTWGNIPDPSASAWFGFYPPDFPLTEWRNPVDGAVTYVSCLTSTPIAPRGSGSCTFDFNVAGVINKPANNSMIVDARLFSERSNFTLLARSSPITLVSTP